MRVNTRQIEQRMNQTGLTYTSIDGFLHQRLKRAVKERMVSVQLIEDIRDNGMRANVFQANKFTIVEIEFMGFHYHGLTSRNPADEPNAKEAVGRAYARALNELIAKHRFGDLKKIRILDKTDVVLVTSEMFAAIIRGTD